MIDAVLDTLYCVFVFNPYSAEIDLDVRIWRLKKRRAHVKLYQLSSLHFQILTSNVDPRTVRIKIFKMA